MRVSLFGLFLRCTNLMGPWPKRIQSILLVISFIPDFLFYDDYVIPVHIYFTCVLTLLSSVLDTCAHPGSPPGIVSYSPGEFHWLPWILMSRFWSLEPVDFPVTDQSGAAVAWISSLPYRATSFQVPCMPLEFSLVNSWVPLYCTYICICCTLSYCSYMYIFCILAFAHQWYNIIVILDHLWW